MFAVVYILDKLDRSPASPVRARAARADRGPGDLPGRPAARPPRPLRPRRVAGRPARAGGARRAAGLAGPRAARPRRSSSRTGCPSTRPTSASTASRSSSPTGGRVATFVERGGAAVAALIHDAALQDEPELVGAVTSAAGIALENERLQADLRARLSDLRASRARIVEAGDTARRKLERDLHDGAQQRLVSLSVVLRLVAGQRPDRQRRGPAAQTARDELNASLEELRNIARGIHPAVLSDHGLPVALESLAARAPVRVTLDVDLDERLPEQVEVAAYYLIAEGLTNVAKYAEARDRATVDVERENGTLVVEVSDDGKGGADPDGGSGLRGLADRVEALDGRLKVWSPPAGGTRLRAEIPCA